MTKILLSSRAFSNQRIISAFSFLFNSNSVDYAVLIVNSTKERKKSPRIIELQHEIKNLGLNVKLFDVLKDNPAVLEQAKAIIFNGGYEFLLLHDLKKANLINKIRLLITANIPV
ncbi:hypothetical protein ACKP2L_00430 (plasmid) [Oenococcus alcoholitolerans]|uniref:hypothetical protein n=1 Tax=Oenococcus alcoholitolerans TaxID=931074 RepID=UPI003F70060D